MPLGIPLAIPRNNYQRLPLWVAGLLNLLPDHLFVGGVPATGTRRPGKRNGNVVTSLNIGHFSANMCANIYAEMRLKSAGPGELRGAPEKQCQTESFSEGEERKYFEGMESKKEH